MTAPTPTAQSLAVDLALAAGIDVDRTRAAVDAAAGGDARHLSRMGYPIPANLRGQAALDALDLVLHPTLPLS